MTEESNGPDDAQADTSSAAAMQAPGRHPVLDLRPQPGAEPTGDPQEPDSFMAALLEGFEEDSVLQLSHGQEVVRLDRSRWLDFARRAKEVGFEVCSDITAVDWFRHRQVRFELVVSLLSMQHKRRLRVLIPLPADDPSVDSVVEVWPGASFGERETYDMYGVTFEGSPDPSRILMPDEWEGYPLRKDFAVGVVPVQFKGSHRVT